MHWLTPKLLTFVNKNKLLLRFLNRNFGELCINYYLCRRNLKINHYV